MEKICQKDGSIIFSIDSISIVFENVSVFDCFKALKIDDKLSDEYSGILINSFITSLGYSADIRFQIHGVGFQLRGNDVKQFYPDLSIISQLDPDQFFDLKFPYVRIDAMGIALDNLRSLGINVEELVFTPLDVPIGSTYHFTRCDFAFDLFDHQPHFLDDVRDFCDRFGFISDGVSCVLIGQSRPVSYSIRTGDQKTIYIGKGRSDKCLRLYDKKMEQQRIGSYNADSFKFYHMLKYLPDSWIRIELQCRREATCHDLIYGSYGDPLRIFRFIFDKYAMREKKGREVPVSDVWLRLFDWDVIPLIIQNANYVSLYIDPVTRARKYLYSVAFTSLALVWAIDGIDAIRDVVNNSLFEWQTNPQLYYKFARWRSRFNPMESPGHLYKNERGIYFL